MKLKKRPEIPPCETCAARYKSIFCNLSIEEIDKLSLSKGCAYYKKDQIIFRAEAYPHGLFCINRGKVKISKIGNEGKEQIVRLAREGDILGYRSLLSGEQYTASAFALEETDICYIPKETFFQILENNATLSIQFMKLLAFDLKEAEEKIINLAQKPVRERLAEALLFLKNIYGLEEDQKTLKVSMKREDIANIAGTSVESTIRTLSEFNKDGLIKIEGKKIKLLELKELLLTANTLD